MFQAAQTLQTALLGEAPQAVFGPQQLIADVQWVSQRTGPSLQRLLHIPTMADAVSRQEALGQMPELALAWQRLVCGEVSLDAWLPERDGEWGAYSDFVSFVMYAGTLTELQDQPALQRLQHLLGLAALRLKLDPLIHAEPALAARLGIVIDEPGYLEPLEIAAACQLRVASVRNAISRREMIAVPGRGVAVGEALDWMVQRRGFLYPEINAITPGRRINGRLANHRLAHDSRVVALRRVSRLRMMLWRMRDSQRCFGINEQGLHHCLVTLPAHDMPQLSASGLVDLEDRSNDPAAVLYQQSFPIDSISALTSEALGQERQDSEAPRICQGVVPTMQALDALLTYLAMPLSRPLEHTLE